jgi:hypothetical protein
MRSTNAGGKAMGLSMAEWIIGTQQSLKTSPIRSQVTTQRVQKSDCVLLVVPVNEYSATIHNPSLSCQPSTSRYGN